VRGADDVVTESATVEQKTGRSARAAVSDVEKQRQSAHIRTAAMLFVVTLVFMLTFGPAFLMSLNVIAYHRLVFYIFFFNNVANPVIYSFMNSYFRRELNAMFCHHHHATTGTSL